MSASCRSCGAPGFWAKTVNGKPILIDEKTVRGGNIEIEAGIARVLPKDPERVAFVAHFANCSQAKQWRRPA